MMKVFWIILLVLQVMAIKNILNFTLPNNGNEKRFYKELLQKLYQQHAYKAVLILNKDYKSECCHKFCEYLKFQEMPTTVIAGNEAFSYSSNFNNQILSLLCMTSFSHGALEQLANLLNYMRFTPTIIIINQKTTDMDINKLYNFFQYTKKLKILNVVVIFKDFYETRSYMQYTIFPVFQIQIGKYDPNSREFLILPERFRNLNGYRLHTIADHTEPRAMEYYDEKNRKILNGYIGRFVNTISETLNATLYYPLEVPHNVILDYQKIVGYVINYSIDIPASSISVYGKDDSRDYSYPFEMGKWCLLLPMEKPLELKEIFLLVLYSPIMALTIALMAIFTVVFYFALRKDHLYQWHFKWTEFLVNDVAIRGVLGQPYTFYANKQISVKLIYLMLFVISILNFMFFGSFLLSFLTQPPLEPEIKTYKDLAKSSLKIAIAAQEIITLQELTNGSLDYLYPKFYIFKNFVEYTKFRDKFDQRFAYPTTSSKLYYYDAIQLNYRTKLFRFSKNMCPNPMMQFKFPLGPNSIFMTPLNDIIMKTLQSGLIDYWISKSYVDVVKSGKAIYLNITSPEKPIPFYVHDLYWIWIYYMIAITVCVLVFALELLVNRKLRK